MRVLMTASLLLTCVSGAQAGDDFRVAVTGAARELSRQLDFLQRSFVNLPGPSMGRGLYRQADDVQYNLIYFQQQLKNNAGREDLYLAFDKMDQKLHTLLDELQNFEKLDAGLRHVASRVRAADHDLQFALTSGDGAGQRPTQTMYRQTLALGTRVGDLENMIKYVFDEQDVLKDWLAAMKRLRREIGGFQQLQQDKANKDDLKGQFLQVDDAWNALVGMFKQLPQQQYVLLQGDAAQVDQVMSRMEKMLSIQNARARLPNKFE